MKNIFILLSLISLITLSNCKRYEDTILTIKIVDSLSNEPVSGVPIFVLKRKPKVLPSYSDYSKIVDTYSCQTNTQGVGQVMIDNYKRKKYWFDVEINPRQKKSNGFMFSRMSIQLEENELGDTLFIRGTKIPFPDPLPKGP